ncbi:MAG: protein translocase subunit SecF [Gemmatimonadales bacterium]
MFRVFANANYDFIGHRRWAYLLSALLIVPGFVLLFARGINYSIEFTGGTAIQVRTDSAVGVARIRTALETGGVLGAEVTTFGSDREYQIKARLSPEAVGEASIQDVAAAVTRALDPGLGEGSYEIDRTEAVGPKVGRELQRKALLAIVMSFVVILAYLAIRFEWRFGVAAVVATAHDVLATISFMSILNLEVSLVLVAAVLTVLGYSLNDKIVILDRVRENLRKYRRQNLHDILNLSVNETLPRTFLTGGSTFATTLVLSFFAGEVIKPFAVVMSFGILVGTFASIYVSPPILLWIEQRWPGQDARGARLYTGSAPVESPTPPPAAGGRPKAAV